MIVCPDCGAADALRWVYDMDDATAVFLCAWCWCWLTGPAEKKEGRAT